MAIEPGSHNASSATESRSKQETDQQHILIDGSSPYTPEQLLAQLRQLGIASETIQHEPLRTVNDAKRLRVNLPGAHTKNLFLRNKKGRMWLLTCLEDRDLNLKSLAQSIGAKQLSFASSTRLMHYLGIVPGAVSPFAVINDKTAAVTVVLDSELRDRSPLNIHPLDNTLTTTISCSDTLAFLNHIEHKPVWFDFERGELES